MMRRTAVVDEIVIDGEMVVMVGDQVILLGPVASLALELFGAPTATDEGVRAAVFAQFGEPPDAEGTWSALLENLVGAGLLEPDLKIH